MNNSTSINHQINPGFQLQDAERVCQYSAGSNPLGDADIAQQHIDANRTLSSSSMEDTSSHQTSTNSAKPAGKTNYLKIEHSRLPKKTEELQQLCDEWIRQRLSVLRDYNENGKRARAGQLDYLAEQSLDRLILCDVGMGRVPWMERSVTSVAMLLDYRSKRFGQRMLKHDDPVVHRVADQIMSDRWNGFDNEWCDLKVRQARAAWTFASEWQRYLNALLICPPKSHRAKNILAEMAHCRPCGALFSSWKCDEWTIAGGREVCRKPLFCPHCNARSATRLVGQVEKGPWSKGRRAGKHLILLRVAISTPALNLKTSQLDFERDQAKYDQWLFLNYPEYYSDCPDGAKINRIESNQCLSHTLTTYEVRCADKISKDLVDLARSIGVTGGLRFHQIGPSQRQFQHELAIVGEVHDQYVPGLEERLGVGREVDTFRLHGQPVECVVVPGAYKDAARMLLAGTSYGFDLWEVGARVNQAAKKRAYCLSAEGENTYCRAVGLRGAMAWQPLFLLSGAAYWSRFKVLRSARHRTYHTFGHWKKLLPSDKKYRSKIQQDRWMQNGGPLKEGWSHDPIRRIERQLTYLGVSKAALAKAAGCSRTAVVRLLSERHGSEVLIKALNVTLANMQREISSPSVRKFTKAEDVRLWLDANHKSISWLATELGWHRSRVSRLVSGKTGWQVSFAKEVAEVAVRLAAEMT
jgi:hypothetical protein